ncbi:methyl-accepting chemotaxis protein [Ureibacillus thermosphaericus]|uniref:methyl-accepting chemotaxis protein n=1 Tax=Ureibacillus thermosphaericus TaxID=51173 RepID=UPI000BBB936A|nr:methyl-accepting chemotaxis protein [Ureibacillus thermosphaericus]
MSIGGKMNVAFYSLIGLLCISMIVSFINFNRIDNQVDEALNERVVALQEVSSVRYQVARLDNSITKFLLTKDYSNYEMVSVYTQLIDQQIAKLEELAATDTMKGYIDELKQYKQAFDAEFAIVNETINYEELNNENIQSIRQGLIDTIDKITQYQTEQLEEIKKETNAAIYSSNFTAVIVLIASLIVSGILVYFVRKTITLPLRKVVEAVKVVSSGNLTEKDLQVNSKDEIGQLSKAFNTMKNNLKTLIQSVQQNSEQLSVAAQQLSVSTEEITSTSEDMSRRVNSTAEVAQTNSQAANDSARAMDETAIGVQKIAESTQLLHSNSIDTSNMAVHGGEIILHAEKQMDTISLSTSLVNDLVQKLSKQTEEIENISRVIAEITDQTNLLALNAAIEAARAGEHGKGFAVVAEEVRKLAEESKESASQITELTVEIKRDTENVEKAVSNSLRSVEDGVKVISEAGQNFANIVKAIEQMKIQIEEISATSEQISASAEEVSAAINEISIASTESASEIQMVATNIEEQAATIEQVNKVAAELNDNAQNLQKEIRKFRIE